MILDLGCDVIDTSKIERVSNLHKIKSNGETYFDVFFISGKSICVYENNREWLSNIMNREVFLFRWNNNS